MPKSLSAVESSRAQIGQAAHSNPEWADEDAGLSQTRVVGRGICPGIGVTCEQPPGLLLSRPSEQVRLSTLRLYNLYPSSVPVQEQAYPTGLLGSRPSSGPWKVRGPPAVLRGQRPSPTTSPADLTALFSFWCVSSGPPDTFIRAQSRETLGVHQTPRPQAFSDADGPCEPKCHLASLLTSPPANGGALLPPQMLPCGLK